MILLEVSEFYSLISRGIEGVPIRRQSMKLRNAALLSLADGRGFTKIAFDTRRINQETEYNPRRGLQNYNRSEAFITESMSQKIHNFDKLRTVLNKLKESYGKEPEWQDSNARILLSTIDKGLRSNINDSDYTDSQPGLGSFDYLEELMHVRYRLSSDDLVRMGEADLKKVILSKDEDLTKKNIRQGVEITKHDVAKNNYDSLLDKLFDGCRASAENPDIERTITITVRDRFNKES